MSQEILPRSESIEQVQTIDLELLRLKVAPGAGRVIENLVQDPRDVLEAPVPDETPSTIITGMPDDSRHIEQETTSLAEFELKMIKKEHEKVNLEWARPILETGELDLAKLGSRPSSAEFFPLLADKVKTFGFSEEETDRIISAWASFSAFKTADMKPGDKAIAPDTVLDAVSDQAQNTEREILALVEYASLYGDAEATQLHQTFGIRHFSRYEHKQLHGQLVSWNAGEDLPEHIVVVAEEDWNGAFASPKRWRTMFDGDIWPEDQSSQLGIYFFEAASGKDVAEVAVDIGNRERQAGRDPLDVDPVKTFTIAAHGSSGSLFFSSKKGGRVLSQDYEQTLKSEADISENDYKKHLGKDFEVILYACETAAPPKNSAKRNFATAMSDGHNARLHATATKPWGVNIVEAKSAVNLDGGPAIPEQQVKFVVNRGDSKDLMPWLAGKDVIGSTKKDNALTYDDGKLDV